MAGDQGRSSGGVDGSYATLDIVRGLAALAVVIDHRGLFPGLSGPWAELNRYGQAGAFIFFVISGYVIFQSVERSAAQGYVGIRSFIGKRMKRIYPPFLMSLLLSLAVSICLEHQIGTVPTMLSDATLTATLFGNSWPNDVYWTLYFEQQFYVLMVVLLLPFLHRLRLPLLLASSLLVLARSGGYLPFHTADVLLIAVWKYFLLGILVYATLHHRASHWLMIPAWLAVLYACVHDSTGGAIGFYGPVAGVFALLMIAVYPRDKYLSTLRWLAPLRGLGMISYTLYLIHLPVFAITDALARLVGLHSRELLYWPGILLALAVAYPLYLRCERPFMARRRAVIVAFPVTSDVAAR